MNNNKNINRIIHEKVLNATEFLFKVLPSSNLRVEDNYKVLVSACSPDSQGLDRIHFLYIIAFLIGTDYTFVLESSYSKPFLLDAESEEYPEHFSIYDDFLGHIDIEPIVKFIEAHPCATPTLLVGESTQYSDVVESISSITNFERTGSLYLDFGYYYTKFSIPKDKALKDIYELL